MIQHPIDVICIPKRIQVPIHRICIPKTGSLFPLMQFVCIHPKSQNRMNKFLLMWFTIDLCLLYPRLYILYSKCRIQRIQYIWYSFTSFQSFSKCTRMPGKGVAYLAFLHASGRVCPYQITTCCSSCMVEACLWESQSCTASVCMFSSPQTEFRKHIS